jgi:hypothetical protein
MDFYQTFNVTLYRFAQMTEERVEGRIEKLFNKLPKVPPC